MSRLIDADFVIDTVNEFKGKNRKTDLGIKLVEEIVSIAPTVDAEPIRHGKWINDNIDKWKCSLCQKGDIYAFKWSVDEGYELQDNYCPNCGASMEGIEE